MYINKNNPIILLGNTDLVNALSNFLQFYNVYQSTKSATYSQLSNEIMQQNSEIEDRIDLKTNEMIDSVMKEIKKINEQNEKIIKMIEEIKNNGK